MRLVFDEASLASRSVCESDWETVGLKYVEINK